MWHLPPVSCYRKKLYTVIHNYRTPSFQRHNLVNMLFIYTKLSRPEREIMLYEVLSEFPQYVMPLPCNACVNVTSERRQGDGVTVSHITLVSSYNFWMKEEKWWNLCRNVGSVLGYAMLRARPIKFHTKRLQWAMTSTKINSIKSTQKRMTIAMKININAGRGWKLLLRQAAVA